MKNAMKPLTQESTHRKSGTDSFAENTNSRSRVSMVPAFVKKRSREIEIIEKQMDIQNIPNETIELDKLEKNQRPATTTVYNANQEVNL